MTDEERIKAFCVRLMMGRDFTAQEAAEIGDLLRSDPNRIPQWERYLEKGTLDHDDPV